MLDFALKNRWLVLMAVAALLVGGLYTMFHLNIEAYPDLTNKQVVVTTEAPGLSPVEVEQLITFPIETSLLGMPRKQTVRSVSKLGLSMITVVFDDSMNIYLARQLVAERLGEAQSRLPQGFQPVLGPLATAFGEVYQYTLQGPGLSLMDKKTLHDWNVRYDLRTIPGVSEINSWGGYTKQYTIEVDPNTLRRFGLTVNDVVSRVSANNANFGGGFVSHNDEQYTIRGLGRAADIPDLRRIVVESYGGVPVLLGDVARIEARPMPRQGAVMHDGKGETVSGMVIAILGTNGRELIQQVKQRIAGMKMPGGVRVVPFYDQSVIIDATLNTVKHNLMVAGLLVLAVLLVFLGNWRAALIVACVIPFSLLFGFMGMALFGVSANLMSLGAVDFGMIVDGSVVMVENFVGHLEKTDGERDKSRVIQAAVHEVARPILFGVAIIIAVYLPIFTLQGLEGRMFHPMAITVCSALIGSLLLALFVVPAVSSYVLKPKEASGGEARKGWFRHLRSSYVSSLDWALRHRTPVLIAAGVLVATALVSLKWIGTEFMPRLDEGSIVITSKKLPGISLGESIYLGDRIEKVIRSFPEVTSVVTKLGRPDLATEAMSIYESDSYISLVPKSNWKCCRTKAELVDKLSKALEEIPGVAYEFTQPMQMRMDEVVTGIRGDVAVKIFGEDVDMLDELATRVEKTISSVHGAADITKDVASGVPELRIELDRGELARYGLNVSDVQGFVEALLGGKQVSEMIQGERRFGIVVRLPESYRNDLDALGMLSLRAQDGALIQLRQVAELRVVRGPEVINRENARRRVAVQVSVRGRDLGGFVKEAQQEVASQVKFPAGYTLDWGGQFENQQRADRRLMIVLPVSIAIIFALLFATFNNLKQAMLILLIVPFALVGGIAALWVRGLDLSLSASIGFIALFGVAVLNGVVMVSHINALRKQGRNVPDAVKAGAEDRLRPVLMTALVASLGFIPMAVATSLGAEVQRPLATVVIGGLITATVLTLYLLPILYPWFSGKETSKVRTTPEKAEAVLT
ncbi:MAG: CusA/CzcA family heavy metal efflux RND transporter [Acidobacteriota bacterium]|nr:CusA/CzcA family heavy metal efflux RND transporter [Acidobacteriota bacterium]